jgi:hypothetical protein
MPSINNFLKGFQDGLPGMKDYRHASRLYTDDNMRLLPKQKFLFHVVLTLNDVVTQSKFTPNNLIELNMLVKACELPRYNMNIEEKTQYNKKMYTATRIAYDPVNITFHDDHADTVNAFWKKYYEYNVADSVHLNEDLAENYAKDDYYTTDRKTTKWGLDTPKQSKLPFIKNIEIFVLHKKRFTSFRLVNPVIGSFNHDNLDAADGTGIMQNTMQILYETVRYRTGLVDKTNIRGWATLHYDNEPSPLSVLGKGTTSIFGPGGIVDGVGSVIDMAKSGNILGAIIGASNTYNNAKKMKKAGVKEELKGIVKEGVLEVGKQAGTITNPVGSFAIGAVAATALTLATSKGLVDNQNKQNTTVISNPVLDSNTYLTADESYNIVITNATIRNSIAAGIYYKDVGSRKGLTIAESDVEYTGSTATTKSVYKAKANTNIRKLVTEGYIKINRTSHNVSIITEKAGL